LAYKSFETQAAGPPRNLG